MTGERGSPAESKNCEILLLPTADRRFDTKVKCPTGRASILGQIPHRTELNASQMPGDCPGVGMGGFGIDWYINHSNVFFCTLHLKPTNLKVRYLIQATESFIFINLKIGIFCAVQETSRHIFNKLKVHKRFRI